MLLFPRLGRRQAALVFTTILDGGPELPDGLPSPEHSLVSWAAGGAPRVTTARLNELRSGVVDAVALFGFPDPLSRRSDLSAIDRSIAKALYDTELTPSEAAVPDVWSFLALVLLPDVVLWRAQGSSNIERFVAADLTRHTLARLWWRAFLFTSGLEHEDDGWDLWTSARIGEADLDQIQTRRGGYGTSPKAFRALVRVYGDFDSFATGKGVSRRELWRKYYLAWLLRLGAFLEFNSLPERLVDATLREFAEEMLRGLPPTVTASSGSAGGARTGDDGIDEPTFLDFESQPLQMIVVYIAETVRAYHRVTDAALPDLLEETTGVRVPGRWYDVVRGIAWQASALGYVRRDGNDGWVPGTTLAAPDRRWGDWSIEQIVEEVGVNGAVDPSELVARVFTGPPGRTVSRLVRKAIRHADARPVSS